MPPLAKAPTAALTSGATVVSVPAEGDGDDVRSVLTSSINESSFVAKSCLVSSSLSSRNIYGSSHHIPKPNFGSLHSQQQQLVRPQSRNRRVVRFDKRASAMLVRHINDYTAEEVRKCWYSCVEQHRMRREMDEEMQILRRAVTDQSAHGACSPEVQRAFAQICRRGLECRMEESILLRQYLIRYANETVLVEQKLQWDDGFDDPEYLATVYSRVTAPSQAEANQRGLQDAKEAGW